MDKASAKKLIRETFERSFDRGRFIYFAKNLLNKIDDSGSTVLKGSHLPDSYKPHIESLEYVGSYEDAEGSGLDVLIVQLKKETSLDRARAMQRNFISWYLNGGRSGVLRDASLVAFVSPSESEWRFSFVKMEYKFVEDKNGKTKVKEEFTPSRRYSFLVGENENSHTAQFQLLPLLENDDERPALARIEELFNIEVVTKEFFEQYRGLCLDINDALVKLVKIDSTIREDFRAKNIDTVEFSKKLLGQIVFLYFLQKKGWFGVEREKDWGTGPKNFFRKLFKKENGSYSNFFNDILEPLFYEALALERTHDYYGKLDCKIPFLNGGLFDPLNNYDWVHTDIYIPNELFSNSIETSRGDTGTGILDIFDRFNFTVREDEPLEKEVAVDPEMLGKVFENLLEVKDRKSKGTYYTPREIVHYMCQESLANYLEAELNGKVGKEEIETLIKFGQYVVEHDSRVVKSGKETDRYSFKLPEVIRQNSEGLDVALMKIKVCDPAVGSGAFLVGMMSEIISIRNSLTNYLNNDIDRSPYNFKRHAIHDCLYGVDIDPGAIEICKLRLWLSLVVDEDDIKEIQPLPNLDYKIVSGNSLLTVKKDLYNDALFKELEELKPLYFNETNVKHKQSYKEKIELLINQITNGKEDFDFEVYFSEVFHYGNGFDVMIANPPYGVSFDKEMKNYLKNKFDYIVERIRNSFLYFLGLAYEKTAKNGIVCFIQPNEFLFQVYMSKARKFFLQNAQFLFVVNVGEDVFEAIVPTCIVALKKCKSPSYEIPLADLRNCSLGELSQKLVTKEFPVSLNETIYSSPQAIFSFDAKSSSFISKLTLTHEPFGGFCEDIANGISTGCDGIYIVSKKMAHEEQFERKYLKDTVRGGQFSRYFCPKKTDDYLLYVDSDFSSKKGKNIFEYLKNNKPLLIQKSVEKRKGNRKWHVLFRSRKPGLFVKNKILIRQTGDRILAAADEEVGYFCIDSVNVALLKNQYKSSINFFIGLLNSRLLNFYYRQISQEQGRVLAQVKPIRIKALPVEMGEVVQRKQIAGKVVSIASIYSQGINDLNNNLVCKVELLERDIDRLVYELYSLSQDEIKIVEDYFDSL